MTFIFKFVISQFTITPKQLWNFTKHFDCKINIIEYNPISQANFVNTDPETLTKFSNFLQEKGAKVYVRRSRGKDIDAACGQLAGKKPPVVEVEKSLN